VLVSGNTFGNLSMAEHQRQRENIALPGGRLILAPPRPRCCKAVINQE
jgi:hypothetical protein